MPWFDNWPFNLGKDKNSVKARCSELRQEWSPRNKRIKDWYDHLLLVDKLAQTDMESYVSNDPATYYDLATALLCQDNIQHSIPDEGIDEAQIRQTLDTKAFIESVWAKHDLRAQATGQLSWLWNLTQMMLVTGWVSIGLHAGQDGLRADSWNPATVYPLFDEPDDEGNRGLVEFARIYQLTPRGLITRARGLGWTLPPNIDERVRSYTVYSHFALDEYGQVVHSIALDSGTILPPTVMSGLKQIPAIILPVGGLPDRGDITDKRWVENIGRSIFAKNEGVDMSYNKLVTYVMQLVRDTSNPRWFERSSGDPILNSETIFKRGAIFRGGQNDDVRPLTASPIPPEVRTLGFDMQSERQRGSLPYSMYGNLQQVIPGYLQQQIAATAKLGLKAQHSATQNVLTQVDNFWLDEIKRLGITPYGFKLPDKPLPFPDRARFKVRYEISIAGDFMARVSAAKTLNPQFTLSTATITKEMFPEVSDALAEKAKVLSDMALQSPVAATVNMVLQFRQEANRVEQEGDNQAAVLFRLAADTLQRTLAPQTPSTSAGQRPVPSSGPPQEVMPNESTANGMAQQVGR